MIWNYSTLAPGNHTIKFRLHNQDEEAKDSEASVTVVKIHRDFEVDSASYQRCGVDILMHLPGLASRSGAGYIPVLKNRALQGAG